MELRQWGLGAVAGWRVLSELLFSVFFVALAVQLLWLMGALIRWLDGKRKRGRSDRRDEPRLR